MGQFVAASGAVVVVVRVGGGGGGATSGGNRGERHGYTDIATAGTNTGFPGVTFKLARA